MVITGAFILETVVKWLIPFICLAIVSIITIKIINPWKKGNKQARVEEWENLANSSSLHKSFEKTLQEQHDADSVILQKLNLIQTEMEQERQVAQNHRDTVDRTLNTLREGVLDAHLINLIYTCENYIRRGYITPNELDHYKQRLKLYYQLGGNGHMEYWDTQINKLPHSDDMTGDIQIKQ